MAGFNWVNCHISSRRVPDGALYGGRDSDGSEIYVGRCHHGGEVLPAKVIPCKGVAYISYGCQEIPKYQCEVLCEKRFKWVPAFNGNVPCGAVEAGRTSSGEPLYVGRVNHGGAVTVGKIHRSHRCCYIPYDMKEMSFSNYEALIYQ